MYTPHSWKPEVEAVEVVRQTAQTVTVLESWGGQVRERRRNNYGNYFDTWGQCKVEMIELMRRKVERAKEELQLRRTQLGQLEAMKPPKDTP